MNSRFLTEKETSGSDRNYLMSLTAVKFCPAAVMFYMELPGRADYIYCLVSIMRPDLCEVSTPGADTAATVTIFVINGSDTENPTLDICMNGLPACAVRHHQPAGLG